MLLERLADDLTITVVVFHSSNLWDSPQNIKGFVVELVDMQHVRICHDNIGQCLHVAETVSKSTGASETLIDAEKDLKNLAGSSVRT